MLLAQEFDRLGKMKGSAEEMDGIRGIFQAPVHMAPPSTVAKLIKVQSIERMKNGFGAGLEPIGPCGGEAYCVAKVKTSL